MTIDGRLKPPPANWSAPVLFYFLRAQPSCLSIRLNCASNLQAGGLQVALERPTRDARPPPSNTTGQLCLPPGAANAPEASRRPPSTTRTPFASSARPVFASSRPERKFAYVLASAPQAEL